MCASSGIRRGFLGASGPEEARACDLSSRPGNEARLHGGSEEQESRSNREKQREAALAWLEPALLWPVLE